MKLSVSLFLLTMTLAPPALAHPGGDGGAHDAAALLAGAALALGLLWLGRPRRSGA